MTDDQMQRRIGERLRYRRLSLRNKQTVVAGLAGITTDYLYQLERGKKLPTLPVLVTLARVLQVPLDHLTNEDAVAVRRVHAHHDDDLYLALVNPPAADLPSVDATALQQQVHEVWRLWQTSPQRYSTVAARLPTLLAQVQRQLGDTDCGATPTAACASDLCGLVRSYAKRTGRLELSLLAADRAIRHAELLEDPVRLATARWNLAHVLLADRQIEGAEQVALQGADALAPHPQSKQTLALHGSLLLVGAMAASRRGEHWTARGRVTQAMRLAERTGDCNAGWTAFGPTNVAMHAACIEVEAGEAAEALRLGERIQHRRSVSIERRVAFLLDQARGYQQRGDNAGALMQLLEAEREAPEDMQHRHAAHRTVHGLIHRARPPIASQAARLADRIHAPLT